MANCLINQDYRKYKNEDHETWRLLCERQSKLPADKVSTLLWQNR